METKGITHIGNYKLVSKIREGGFGRVFQGEHLILKEKACIKQNKIETPEAVELLKNEAKILWNLDGHHSIPYVKEFIKINNTNAALISSYIEGKTVEDIVKENCSINPEEACRIAERLFGALYYLHRYGIIHGDIKPGNVFYEPEKYDVKLIDFGAAVYQPKKNSRAKWATIEYAPPEILRGDPPIPQTDFYGVGIVLMTALGGDAVTKEFIDNTPKQLEEFCNQLLEYNPLDRPSWEEDNPMTKLSDIRLRVFGRRHVSDKVLKGGDK